MFVCMLYTCTQTFTPVLTHQCLASAVGDLKLRLQLVIGLLQSLALAQHLLPLLGNLETVSKSCYGGSRDLEWEEPWCLADQTSLYSHVPQCHNANSTWTKAYLYLDTIHMHVYTLSTSYLDKPSQVGRSGSAAPSVNGCACVQVCKQATCTCAKRMTTNPPSE